MQNDSATTTVADEIRLLLLRRGVRSVRAWIRQRRAKEPDFPSESTFYHAISGRRANATTERLLTALATDTGRSRRSLEEMIHHGTQVPE